MMGCVFHYSITLINRIQGNPHSLNWKREKNWRWMTHPAHRNWRHLLELRGAGWTHIYISKGISHFVVVFFFFRFPPTAKQFHFSKQQQQKRNNYDPVPFSIRRKSLPRSRKFRQKKKHSLGALRTKFLFFFVFPGVVFFCSVFSRTAGDHPWKVYYIETKERKRALYIFRGWLDYPLCFKFLTGWDAEIRRKKKEKMINDEQKKRFLFFSFQTGTAPNAMNRFLWNCRSLSLPQDRQKAQLSLFNNFSSAQRKMNEKWNK